MDLSNLSILVKTFLRDGYLFDCVADLRANFPEATLVIMDDGYPTPAKNELYQQLRLAGHTAEYLPFDSGFSAKSDAAIPLYKTPYVLIGSDDFAFAKRGVREGVEKMVDVLEYAHGFGAASGRLNDNMYEGWLDELEPGKWRERWLDHQERLTTPNGTLYRCCEITVNYSVFRTAMLGTGPRQVVWGNHDIKIGGGEHGALFLAIKRAGWRVAYVPGANITEFPYDANKVHPTYSAMRGRARVAGRPALRRAGVTHYQLFDGTVEVS